MDGLTFLANLMRLRPMPVVMVSSLTERGADATLRALELGAFDFVPKPKLDLTHSLQLVAEELCAKVLAAARATPRNHAGPGRSRAPAPARLAGPSGFASESLLAIGASTGGTEAIRAILETMPAGAPGLVITQHIPPSFSAAFARRLDQASALVVTEAEDGVPVLPGHAYVAPGGRHLEVVSDGPRFRIHLSDGERVNRHRPSVDVMFDSLVSTAAPRVVAALLTGMGSDGAKGLSHLRAAGAQTLAQDEATSAIFGMPKEAVRLGAAREVLPLDQIPKRLLELAGAVGVGPTV